MTVSIPPGFAEIIIPMDCSLSTHVATVSFGVDWSGSVGSEVATLGTILAAWGGAFAPLQDNSVTIGPVHAIIGQDGEPTSADGVGTVTGGVSASSLPANVAVLVQKHTSTGGRRGRGRFYVPWALTGSAANEAGVIDSSVLATLRTAASDFLDALEGTANMQVLHSPGISTAPEPSPVTSLSVASMVATQRRRLGR